MSQTVFQSLEEFCSLLSNKMWWLAMPQDPWKSGFLCGARMYPLHKPWFIRQHIVTAYFVPAG